MTHWRQNNEKMDKYAHLFHCLGFYFMSQNSLKKHTPICIVLSAPGQSTQTFACILCLKCTLFKVKPLVINVLCLISKNRNENDDGEEESLGYIIVQHKTAALYMMLQNVVVLYSSHSFV